MNVNTATKMVGSLCPEGVFKGADWFGPNKAVMYFWCGYSRNTVEDFGLSPAYNSGPTRTAEVTVTDRHLLRALRKCQRA